MKYNLIKIFAIAGAMIWWALFYPELSFIDGTYQVVWMENEKQTIWQNESVLGIDMENSKMEEDMTLTSEFDKLSGLLKAGKEEVVVESKLLEWLRKE